MFIALIVLGAVVNLIITGTQNSLAHERQADAASVAQDEIEAVRQIVKRYGFDALAMTASPAAGSGTLATNPSNPNDYVTGSSLRIALDYRNSSRGYASPSTEPLVIGPVSGATAQVNPQQTVTVSSAAGVQTTYTIYRYVTQRTPVCRTTCGTDDRRVTIAVVHTAVTSSKLQDESKPVWVSTVITRSVPSNQANSGQGLEIGVNLP
jgi:type II secretory pathway pseudopilin PulG